MLLLERAGDHNPALEVYERYARRLRAEYESNPTADVQEFSRREGAGSVHHQLRIS